MVPYNYYTPSHISRPSAHSSRNTRHTSSSSSSSRRSPPSAPSRHSSSRSSSSSSASSTVSSYTQFSTMTFGISSRPGYAPGQAPHDYFYNEDVREEWDNVPVGPDGRRVRQTRIRGRGSAWSGQDSFVSPMSSIGEGGSRRGSGHRGFVEAEDDGSGDETVSPADSISQVSSQPSRYSSRRSGVSGMGSARDYHPRSGYSQRPSMVDARQGGMSAVLGGSRAGSGISVANGRLVRVEVPDFS